MIYAVFLIVLAGLFYLFLSERKLREKSQKELAETLSLVSQYTSTVAQAAAEEKERIVARYAKPDKDVAEKVRPFVEAASSLPLTGDQKRMQVILGFLKEHPGHSVEQAENAIEAVLGK